MSPNAHCDDGHQYETYPHELAHGLPYASDDRVPTSKSGNLRRQEKHGHKGYTSEEHGVVQPTGPQTSVILVVIHRNQRKAQHTQNHAPIEHRLCFAFKYKLCIQIHTVLSLKFGI